MEKELGISGKTQIEEYGIAKFPAPHDSHRDFVESSATRPFCGRTPR
jgi:hypothetical protein